MNIYQLHCTGNSINGWKFSMYSKKVFTNFADAEKYIPDFITLCADDTFFEAVEGKSAKVTILTLELN